MASGSWIATVAEAGLKVGQTFLSAHVAEEALSAVSGTGRRQAEDASAQMCLLCFCLQDNRKDGRFFTTLRMTCIAITIAEMFRSYLRQTCHPEEAGLKVGQTFLSARMEPCQQSGRRNLRANVITAFLPSGQSNRREILRCAQNDMLLQ